MIIILKTSGGMGVTYSARIDTSNLPEPVREKASQFFSDQHLTQIQHKHSPSVMTDTISYELIRESDEASFSFTEAQLSNDELEMLDEIKSHMTPMKK